MPLSLIGINGLTDDLDNAAFYRINSPMVTGQKSKYQSYQAAFSKYCFVVEKNFFWLSLVIIMILEIST